MAKSSGAGSGVQSRRISARASARTAPERPLRGCDGARTCWKSGNDRCLQLPRFAPEIPGFPAQANLRCYSRRPGSETAESLCLSGLRKCLSAVRSTEVSTEYGAEISLSISTLAVRSRLGRPTSPADADWLAGCSCKALQVCRHSVRQLQGGAGTSYTRCMYSVTYPGKHASSAPKDAVSSRRT